MGGNDHVKKTGEKNFFTEEIPSYASKAKEVYANTDFTLSKTEPTDLSGKHDAIAMGYLDAFLWDRQESILEKEGTTMAF